MVQVLVTAGPTHEHLDDVRFLANASSGRTGFAIAEAAARAGCDVVLIAGPVSRPTPPGVRRIDVVSAQEMHDTAVEVWPSCGIAFGVAAVADLRPKNRHQGKPAKEDTGLVLELERNPDVIAALGHSKRDDQCVVGFALEAGDADGRLGDEAWAAAERKALGKIERKRLDFCVLNGPAALGGDRSETYLVESEDGSAKVTPLGERSKDDFASLLVDRAMTLWRSRSGVSDGGVANGGAS
ncbi:MAG: phosphopantothenoylcysteine decarboxylase [Planctomycetota bacterium]